MPKIQTIEKISNSLGSTSIAVNPKRCTYIRNWHSRCRNCLNACQHDAIKRSIGRLSIDSDLCTDCGACMAACPTGAMLTTAPTASELVEEAQISARANGGRAVFACALHAEQLHIDTEKVVTVACLNYLDEYLLCGLFAVKVRTVTLLRADCEGCEIDCTEPYFDLTVSSIRPLLEQWGIQGTVEVCEDIPDEFILKGRHAATIIRSDRREAFKQAGGSMMGFLARTASDLIDTVSGEPPKRESTDKRVIVRPEETFPANTYRSSRLLTMLDFLGARPYGQVVESRFWANVNIDPEQCRHCGACAKMCATRALNFEEHEDGTGTLTFQPKLCFNCRLCKDACLTRSMVYSNKVPADDLDDDTVIILYDHEKPVDNKSCGKK